MHAPRTTNFSTATHTQHTTASRTRRDHHSAVSACAVAAAVTITLSACDGSSDDPDGDDTSNTSDSAALLDTLERVEATPATTAYVEFGNVARINEMNSGSFHGVWGSLDGWGGSQIFQYREQLPDVLGIDTSAAKAFVTAGQQPETVTLVVGGQDADQINSTATASGWTGDGILTQETDPDQPLSVQVTHIAPIDSDVALGGESADLSVVDPDSQTLAEAAEVGGLASCLDDVIAALFVRADPYPVALGVRPDADEPDTPVSVMCVLADSAGTGDELADRISNALDSGEISSEGRSYTEVFVDPVVDVVDEYVVRMEATHAPDTFANVLFTWAIAGGLPGFDEPLMAGANREPHLNQHRQLASSGPTRPTQLRTSHTSLPGDPTWEGTRDRDAQRLREPHSGHSHHRGPACGLPQPDRPGRARRLGPRSGKAARPGQADGAGADRDAGGRRFVR